MSRSTFVQLLLAVVAVLALPSTSAGQTGFCQRNPGACSEQAARFCAARPVACRREPEMTCVRFPELCRTVGPNRRIDLARLHASVELTLVTPTPLTSVMSPQLAWKLTNRTPIPLTGDLRLKVDGQDRPASFPAIAALPLGQSVGGSLTVGPYAPGPHAFRLEFMLQTGERWDVVGPTGPLRRTPTFEVIGAADVDLSIEDANPPLSYDCPTNPALDRDRDCLDDRLERLFLERYSPYYKFSMETGSPESLPPTDVGCYLTEAELKLDGQVIVPNSELASGHVDGLLDRACPGGGTACSPDVTKNTRGTDYQIERIANRCTWADAADRKTGLYGHVVPYDPASDQQRFQPYFETPAAIFEGDPASGLRKRYIKVEYWQYFAHNGWVKPHQGDWTTVQLLIDIGARGAGLTKRRPCQTAPVVPADVSKDSPLLGEIAVVLHYAHGTTEYRFDFDQCTGVQSTGDARIVEVRGPNYSRPECPGIGPDFICEDQNVAQFYKVDTEPIATHPVVYLEYATHEYMPIGAWTFAAMPSSTGDDEQHRYLTVGPPNLGEVGAPLDDTPHAALILHFNGKWGDDPRGPTLHEQWTWPSPSGIAFRTQLEGNGLTK